MVFKDLSGENSYVNGSEIGLNFAYEISDPRLEAGNGPKSENNCSRTSL